MSVNADKVGEAVLLQYDRLPLRGLPRKRENNKTEWTVLAGVVIDVGNGLECVSLATGVKTTPEDRISSAKGRIIHDMHAEILALRAFNLFLVDEATRTSKYVKHKGKFVFCGKIYLYVSHPPCGDASLSLLSGNAWEGPSDALFLRGRAHFNVTGAIRTKPGRADSEMSMSKSCSDKLCLAQVNSVVRKPVAHLFDTESLYLSGLVCAQVLPEFERCFSRWSPVKPFEYVQTSLPFKHAKGDVPCTTSVIWTPGRHEVLANGLKHGFKPGDPRACSSLSRYGLTMRVLELDPVAPERYLGYKRNKWYPPGWVQTAEDDFLLDDCVSSPTCP